MLKLYGKEATPAIADCHGYGVMERMVGPVLFLLDVRQSFALQEETESEPWYYATR